MTTTELRALDLQMAEFMGWKRVSSNSALLEGQVRMCITGVWRIRDGNGYKEWSPTESPADAMMVLKKLAEKHDILLMQSPYDFHVQEYEGQAKYDSNAPTLELAICLFAKEVSKQ